MKHILSSVAAQRGAKPLIVGAVLAGVALLFVQAATVSPSGFDPAADYPDASGLTITDANDLSDDQSYTYTTAARSSSSVHTSASAHGAQNAEVNPRAANGESAATPRAPRAAHANTPARADRDAPRQLAQAGGRNSIAAARSLSAVASPRAGSTHVSSSDSPASGGHGSSSGAGGGGPVGSNNAQGESQRPAKAEPASERHAASVNQSGANDIKSDTADSLVAPPSTETAFEPLPSLTEATTAGIDPENAIGPSTNWESQSAMQVSDAELASIGSTKAASSLQVLAAETDVPAAASAVPDAGQTFSLLGVGLAGLLMFGRRFLAGSPVRG